MKPLVSVITLTYKNYDKLYETIKSVLVQDYSNIEYIISDDASGDFPRDEVESFIKENNKNGIKYKIIVNDNNLGTVKNFNNAIKNTNGDYIFPLSGNDIFFNESVVTDIVKMFLESKCQMVITSRVNYFENRTTCVYPHIKDIKYIMQMNNNLKKYKALMLSEHYGMFIGCNMYYDRNALEKYGLFDEKYRLLEDLPILEKFMWYEKVDLKPGFYSIYHDAKTGVTLRRHSAHPLLQKDINLYNRSNRMGHYNELDHKTRDHIDFGIERTKVKNGVQLAFICLRHVPRIISYLCYCFRERIIWKSDKKVLSRMDNSFL
ncbi:MAG: glycosyltransferase family 2 protein [Eubacterium sp.]|nr:glycosyltransferase family 2 protein [Eubacterium sp.]